MPFITVGSENSGSIDVYYEDHGDGNPVVLVQGFPLNGRAWEKQEAVLLGAGRRVITYDRRGFGASSRPSVGYDYTTFAADLDALLRHLSVTDVTLVGFSAGTGDVVRYLGTRGSERIARAVLIGPLPPFLPKTADNPDGIDPVIFDKALDAISADRLAAIKVFLDAFYNIDVLGGSRVSDQVWHHSFNVAAAGSAKATVESVSACLEDFRGDLDRINIPVLVLQGDEDRVLAKEATGDRLPGLLRDIRHVVIRGGPHAIYWTHDLEVNRAILDFIDPVRVLA